VPAETFDTYRYPSGGQYVVTDHGPNVWAKCALCGAPAACTPERSAATVRCGQCLLVQFKMLPGQQTYELKAQYVREHPLPRVQLSARGRR
jgi:hypothetical protein